jgi:DNA-binding GntR family transcriptional regulator
MDEQTVDERGRAPDTDDRGPIVRQSLHEAIVSRVRDMIVEGTLASGSRVHEGNLGRELGVSRTPLREALKFLASEGLIELAPGRGAVVREFSAQDIHDSLIVLAHLEALGGRLACVNGTDAQIGEMRDLHERMVEMYRANERRAYFKLNHAIHSGILRMAGNAALIDVHGMLLPRLRRVRYLGHEGPENWAAAVAEHEVIIQALQRRDGATLSRAIADHIEAGWHRMKDVL